MIVADANLILARCVQSTRTELANQVFSRDRAWIAPKLWQTEFVSALIKHHRESKFDRDVLDRALYLAESLMRGMDYDSDLHDVTAVALRTNCFAYDSAYIALAEEKRAKLVTSDGGILENAKHVAVSPEQFLVA
jgi:predicted nucleic acid-binding protein